MEAIGSGATIARQIDGRDEGTDQKEVQVVADMVQGPRHARTLWVAAPGHGVVPGWKLAGALAHSSSQRHRKNQQSQGLVGDVGQPIPLRGDYVAQIE